MNPRLLEFHLQDHTQSCLLIRAGPFQEMKRDFAIAEGVNRVPDIVLGLSYNCFMFIAALQGRRICTHFTDEETLLCLYVMVAVKSVDSFCPQAWFLPVVSFPFGLYTHLVPKEMCSPSFCPSPAG